MAEQSELSDREVEILKLVATGASNKEIALALSISTNTVKVHLRNIFSKIEATSRTEAAMYAVNAGLVSSGTSGTIRSDADLVSGVQPERRGFSALNILLLLLVLIAVGLGLYFMWFYPSESPADLSPNPLSLWQENVSLPTARYGMAASVYENLIYTIGGETDQGVVDTVERYNPATNSWESLERKPTPASDVSSEVIGGKIYVPGGRTSNDQYTNVLEVYDIRSDLWTTGAGLPVAFGGYALSSFEGNLYIFGGWDGIKYLNTVYEYNPESDEWTEMQAMPTPRAYATAALSGEKIYVMGGVNSKGVTDKNEVFIPTLAKSQETAWNETTPLPGGRYGLESESIADIIYVIGGIRARGGNNSSLQFIPHTGEWQEFIPPFDKDLVNFGLVSHAQNLFVIGGKLENEILATNQVYQVIYSIAIPIVQ